MYRNRQNKINRQSPSSLLSKISQNALNEYGIADHNNKKKLIKSKSHKDVLIFKDKKLIDFFPLCQKKHIFHANDVDKSSNGAKSHAKLTLKVNKKIEVQNQPKAQQQIQTFRTSYFGGIEKYQVKNTMKQKAKNITLQDTLQSDKYQAKKLKQRLKKSTSMQNLIQQRFLSQHNQQNFNKQSMKENIYTQINNNDYQSQTYDSKKYNWRLSLSKEKLREKSLSTLQLKAKVLNSLHKKQEFKNKLSLDLKKNIQKNPELKNYQPIKKFDHFSQIHAKHSNQRRDSQKDYKAYTFGSDFYKTIHFH